MLIPDGEYDFQVIKAEEGLSKKGAEMITLTLNVYLPNGSQRSVKDWLVGSDAPMCIRKIRHFAKSCNLMALYEQGAIDQYACEGACGKVKIGSQESAGYGVQNCVDDYVTESEPAPEPLPKGPTAAQTKAANGVAESDDVPF